MAVGAYSQDLLTNIVNVQWGGAVFILGDDSGQIWRCEIKSDDEEESPELTKLSEQFGVSNSPEEISPGEVLGGSFARIGDDNTPTFVLTGIDFDFVFDEDGVNTGLIPRGIIKRSIDGGETWETVFDVGNTTLEGLQRRPARVIWDDDDQKFYVDMDFKSDQPPVGDRTFATETWASSDGRHWTMVASLEGQVLNTVFESHCKYKRPSDPTIGLANGQFGVDPAEKDSTDTPAVGTIVDDGLLITIEDYPSTLSSINFVGGVWGRALDLDLDKFEVSFDDAATWTFVGADVPYAPVGDVGNFTVICAGEP